MQNNEESNVILPVSASRIRDSLKRLDYKFFVDEHGNFCTIWNHYIIVNIHFAPNYPLIIHVTFHRLASMDFANPFKTLSENVNSTFIEAKTYVTSDDDGATKFHIENIIDVFVGLSDKQLDTFISSSIENILEIYAYLEESFPDPLSMSGGVKDYE